MDTAARFHKFEIKVETICFVAQSDQLRNHTTSVAFFAHAAAELQLLRCDTLGFGGSFGL